MAYKNIHTKLMQKITTLSPQTPLLFFADSFVQRNIPITLNENFQPFLVIPIISNSPNEIHEVNSTT